MTRLLILLLLTGCSASAPTQYAQGMPVAPRAPTFNPTWDAPHTTGQPGYVGSPERAPRSHHKRVLPPTKEPGLWASESPRAIAVDDDAPILGVYLPFPEGATTPADKHVTVMCASTMRDVITTSGLAPLLTSQPPAMRRCVAAHLFKHCAQFILDSAKNARESGVEYDVAAFRNYTATLAAAQALYRSTCTGLLPPPDVAVATKTITETWTELRRLGY